MNGYFSWAKISIIALGLVAGWCAVFQKVGKLLSCFLLLVVFAIAEANCAPSGFAEGVKAYNARQYSVALTCFTRAAQSAPTDANTRYYMGLCYQGMNQMKMARTQYEWVAKAGAGNIRAQASAALANLDKYASSSVRSASSSSTSTSGSYKSGPLPPPAAAPKLSGRLKILEFYTDWCPHCRDFEPIWDSVASRMSSRVDMRQYNGDDEGSASLKQKYNIRAYPHVIFTDNTGAVLHEAVSYKSADAFMGAITKIIGK